MTKTTETPKRRISRRNLLLAGIIVIVLCIACIAIVQLSPSTQSTATPIAQNPSAGQATEAPTEPSATPAPSNTPEPTNTPKPTNTPRPTNTPAPTSTPTEVPTPIVFEGSGDQILDVDKWEGVGIVHISAPNNRSNIAIMNLDENNDTIDLLVNEIGAYEGYVPIDLYASDHTVRLRVEAGGPWKIEILPLSLDYVHSMQAPGTYEAKGDDVVIIQSDARLDTAHYVHQGQSNFAVIVYSPDGGDLLINEIGSYDGTVLMPGDAILMVVTADGQWSVEVTTR